MENFSPDAVDAEFLPYLYRINGLPFVVTVQSCVGHLTYDKYNVPQSERPFDASEKWGYLQLMLTLDVAEWLCNLARNWEWEWLWVGGSQLWMDGATIPELTTNESCKIAFAWDSGRWPAPASDITRALEAVYAAGLTSESET